MNLIKKPNETPNPSHRYDEVLTLWKTDALASWKNENNALLCVSENNIFLKIQVFSADILRISYAPNGHFEKEFTHAVPSFALSTEFSTIETQDSIELKTALLKATVQKSDLKLKIENNQGIVLSEDCEGYSLSDSVLQGVCEVKVSKKSPLKERYFGLGDKACTSDMRGLKFSNWCEDAFAFWSNTDKLYRAIPFYIAENQGFFHGIFLDNTHRSHFEFGIKNKKVHKKEKTPKEHHTSFGAEGGEMCYYFFGGATATDIIAAYTRLTGLPELPPLWALGYHQCRWSYYPESRVQQVADTFRKLSIPCDAIWLDIDYMDGYRCFTWDKKRFPQPAKMVKNLEKKGFKTIFMIDPGIKLENGYSIYDQGKEQNLFCRRSDGSLMKGAVWPGDCVFPDFSNPKARQWWAGLYTTFFKQETPVHGVWNDMNEPAVFEINNKTFPDNVLHDNDGNPCDHRRIHNVYGMLMARATYEGLQQAQPEKRPFVLSRASFSGGQRYAAIWTGDNIASWEHLHFANIQCQRLSVSGYSFCGSDIGGFVNIPDGELLVRWLQLGIFHPLMRNHTMGDHADGSAAVDEDAMIKLAAQSKSNQEPWSFGEKYTTLAKEAIELRYKLLPYLYTAMQGYCTQGIPVITPIVMAYPNDPKAAKHESQFLWGDSLLVAPVERKNATSLNVWLPEGDWYDYHSGKLFKGNKLHKIKVQIGTIPIFAKAGTIIPEYPIRQYVGEKEIDLLTLRAFPLDSKAQGSLYEDSGNGFSHQKGNFLKTNFSLHIENEKWTLSQEKQGDFKPSYNEIEVLVAELTGFRLV